MDEWNAPVVMSEERRIGQSSKCVDGILDQRMRVIVVPLHPLIHMTSSIATTARFDLRQTRDTVRNANDEPSDHCMPRT